VSRSPLTVAGRFLSGLVAALVLTARLAGRALGWLGTAARSLARSTVRWLGWLRASLADLAGPTRRHVVGPVRVGLLGRRPGVSLLAVLLAPVLALAVAWALSGVGFDAVREAVVGTWTGRDPALVVLLAAAALVALGAASSAVNSGLLPTTLLVSAPVFGAGLLRYGTEPTVLSLGPVVSLPEAVGVATLLAVAFGVPLACGGFLLGAALRRVFRVFEGGREPLSGHEA
jgi:hypothetical protein